MIEPRGAGFEALLIVPSWLMTAAWPVPVPLTVKMPGTAATTGSCMKPIVWPPERTLTNVDDVEKGPKEGMPGLIENGTTALIWQFEE